MFYCPKCQRQYEEGTQRFCTADNTRLIAGSSPGGKTGSGVFFNILQKAGATAAPNNAADKVSPAPLAIPPNDFFPPVIGKPETADIPAPPIKRESQKPLTRLIKPGEIASGQAALGNRETNPTGRLALTLLNPQILLGQTIKGRYYITEFVGQDTASFCYTAEDKLNANKKVAVRVLMNPAETIGAAGKIFAEERVSLAHVNHPNIAKTIDSGELPEGKPFIVSEAVSGESLQKLLEKGTQMNVSCVARIVRQAADALGEVHRNGVLHRRLTPADVILTINEKGGEQVKLINFGVSAVPSSNADFVYQSPEQLQGKTPTYAGDLYSLAVIAYQMLTARLPFRAENRREMLKQQREGIKLNASNLRLDAPPLADRILEKALHFDSSERYPKTSDFGMAFFNALTAVAPWRKETDDETRTEIIPAQTENQIGGIKPKTPFDDLLAVPGLDESPTTDDLPAKETPIVNAPEKFPADEFVLPETDDFEIEYIDDDEEETETPPAAFDDAPANAFDELFANEAANSDIHIKATTAEAASVIKEEIKPADDLAWERRSTDAAVLKSGGWTGTLIAALGVLLLCAGLYAVWYYFLHRPVKPEYTANTMTVVPTAQIESQPSNTRANTEIKDAPPEIETPPLPREISAPPDSAYFENTRENLDRETLRNFRGFSLYYPNDWKRNKTDNKFIDISRDATTGTPIEQFLVSYYPSKGTYKDDQTNFPELVKKSNEDLSKILPNYKVISQGEATVNNGWRAYEVKFESEGKTASGEKVLLWGRRLYIPAARPGVQSGFLITMLATSLSKEVESVNDVGVKGELGSILYTFEPDANY